METIKLEVPANLLVPIETVPYRLETTADLIEALTSTRESFDICNARIEAIKALKPDEVSNRDIE